MVEPSDVSVWRAALRNDALLSAAAACDVREVSAVARLRKVCDDAAVVRAALAMVAARAKAPRKFGTDAARLFADVEGVEQATSRDAARPKAARFARLVDAGYRGPVLDLGCGIGADAMALRGAGVADVVAVDIDPVRAAMAASNAKVSAVVADMGSDAMEVRGRLIHLDPARRRRLSNESASRRTFALEDLEPSPAVLRRLIERSAGAAVKLSPGMEAAAVREALGEGEACFTSEPAGLGQGEARKLTQATWFTGALRERPAVSEAASRRAVCVQGDGRWREVCGEPVDARDLPVAKLGRFLVVPDPAVERAELLHRLGLATRWPGLGLLTGDRVPGDDVAGLCRGFEVVAEMPWRVEKVKRWLAEHRRGHGGVVEAVKTRGQAVDPDAVLRQLRWGNQASAASEGAALVVFVLRLGSPVVAIVTRPVSLNQGG